MLGRLRSWTIALLAGSLVLTAGAAAEPLDGQWEFRFDHADAGMTEAWQHGRWEEDWTDVEVPHAFNTTAVPSELGGTIGWYRIRFTAPPLAAGRMWSVRFEGARRETRVWLNGVLAGDNVAPYVPFSVPLHDLEPGAVNELVVRVSNRRPRMEGWWNWGGLVRPVRLVAHGATLRLDDWAVLGRVKGKGREAAARLDGWLVNDGPAPQEAELQLRVGAGRPVKRTIEVPPGEVVRVGLTAGIPRPVLWKPDRPHTYAAEVTVLSEGRELQRGTQALGLRTVQVRRGRLRLNGRALNLRGASIHEDLPGRGAALRESDLDTIVSDLRALGADVTRAHYGLHPQLQRRLDDVGILVWSQAPVYQRLRRLNVPSDRARALDDVRRTVLEARRHPSTLVHSIGNELLVDLDRDPSIVRFVREAAAIVRDLDPDVPVALDILSYPGYPRQRAYDAIDVLGINGYYGWYAGQRDHPTGRLSDLPPYLAQMRRQYPGHALVLSEFGAEAAYSGHPDEKGTYEFQSHWIDRTLDVVDEHPWLGGAIYWTLREFEIRPGWAGGATKAGIEQDTLHNKGLLAYDGTPKPAWELMRGRFADARRYADR